jgi:hypothetical protein
MPTFCRHSRLVQNCPICSREQAIEMRPIVSSPTPRSSEPRRTASRAGVGAGARTSTRGPAAGLKVRRLARGADDGYHCALVPGLRSSEDAARLAAEVAFAALRLEQLEREPPGLYAEVRGGESVEERTWLAFLIAYLCPLDGADPFGGIERVRTTWASGELPDLEGAPTGPRSAHDPARGSRTLAAYRAWVSRSGSQESAYSGDPAWSAERRFARLFERLALPGLNRDARFELLVSLGRLGAYDLRAGSLALGGENDVTLAAKRVLGIGDSLLLDRRAAELARAGAVPREALDLGLYNWGRGERATMGFPDLDELDSGTLAGLRATLEL